MSKTQKHLTVFSIVVVLTFLLMYFQFSYTQIGTTGSLLVASFMAGLTVILGLITYVIQHYRQREAYATKQKSSENMATEQSREIEIDVPFELAFDMVLAALDTLNKQPIPKTLTGIPSKQILKIHQTDRRMGRIKAGLRAKTIGIQDIIDFSRIEIQLQRLDSQSTRIKIDSRPTNPLEMMDLGRHTHYVNHLALYLRKESQQQRAMRNLVDSKRENVRQLGQQKEEASEEMKKD